MKFNRPIFFIFITCTTYILSVQLILIEYPSLNTTFYRLNKFFLALAYSLTASSLFYYVAVYLPKQAMKRKIFPSIYRRNLLIKEHFANLFYNLEIAANNNDYKNVAIEIDRKCKQINPDAPIENYANWHQYLYFFKSEVVDIIRSVTFYHEYLDKEYFTELTLLEDRFVDIFVFSGSKQLLVNNLSYANITLHELYVHNNILQKINASQFEKNKKMIEKEVKLYRKKYYKD